MYVQLMVKQKKKQKLAAQSNEKVGERERTEEKTKQR